MAREVCITGYGLLSALGDSPESWLRTLSAPERWRGKIDAATYAPFPIHPIAPYPLEKQVPKPGDQRAMGPLMQYGAYAAGLALDKAGIKGDTKLLGETHLIVAAGGGERDWEVDRQILAKLDQANDRGAFLNRQLSDGLRPTLFLAQLPNLFAGNISLIHGVAGSSRTFMGEEAAGVDALRVALRRCAAGQGDVFLVGAAFNAARPDLHQQYHMGGVLLTGAWQPLWHRPESGICLGSAGAFLVIEPREHAERRGARPLARLVAVESERSARTPGAARATAVAELGRVKPRLGADRIALLSGASGRGSITAEERAFLEDFGNTGKIAVRGTAAAFGHTLECAFLLNLALAVSVLEARSLFPPLDAAEPLETPLVGTPRQILVTSWGHARGVGTALVEAIDGKA